MRVDWCVSSWFRIKNTRSLTRSRGSRELVFSDKTPFDMLPVAAALAACGRATSRAAGRRLGARGDWLVARRREIPIPSRLVGGEGPFDMWKLAKDARELAL